MKFPLLVLSCFSFCCSLSQDFFLFDTAMSKALSEGGYREPGIDFKSFKGTSTDGRLYTEDSLRGKITFINFWFRECAPCIAELPILDSINKKYKSQKDFQLLSFTFEKSEDILYVANKYPLNYTVIMMGKDSLYELIFKLGFPTNIITDRAGKIVFIKCGGEVTTDARGFNKRAYDLFVNELERLLRK